MTTVILFVFGTIVGSFLNVVALRWTENIGDNIPEVFGGRSKCLNCSRTLHWFELIPLFSFILQKGRCRSCQSHISYQYLIVEILTGFVFITVPLWMLPVFSIYIIILIYDWHHKIIPDKLVYTAVILSIVSRWLLGGSAIDWLAGPIIFLFFALIWLLSRGRAMGFGDAKLGLSVGLLLASTKGFSAIIFAFWIGAVFALSHIFLSKIGFIKDAQKLTMKSEVPFAPFIILGAWLSIWYELNLFYVW